MDKLKSLTRFRDSLVRQLVELTNTLDKTFSEFKPFFKGRLSVTALYILANYQTPEKIANMRAYEPLRKLSRSRFTMSDFIQLKALAKNTVGSTNDYLVDQMGILLELYNLTNAKVGELDDQIRDCIRDIDPSCLSMPGIGELSTAIILSEFGDFSKFQNPSKMLSFAGLEPGYFQSGQSEFTGHMVKHGSSKLRCALLNCCLPLVTNEPVFAEYYGKKQAEGKSHRAAMTHVAKKLLRVIYTLQTKNVPYDPDRIR
jgi:transposase